MKLFIRLKTKMHCKNYKLLFFSRVRISLEKLLRIKMASGHLRQRFFKERNLLSKTQILV